MSLLTNSFGNENSGNVSGQPSPAAPAPGRSPHRLVQLAAAQRIRLGLTGLAAIFLLVMVAAASLKPGHPAVAADPQAEPLAVLGVAPGAATNPAAYDRAAPPAAAAAPVAPRLATRT